MLPVLPTKETLEKIYADFCNDLLSKKDFKGEIRTDYATRLSVATDNSIYQNIPQLVLFPKTTEDMQIALQLAAKTTYKHTIKFAPRGGGTATNGQSLTKGIVIDCSKYMRHILDVNMQEGFVRVQAGVVLDQLNAFLQPLGFYFPPQVSTSNRATLGGMINTDACGNGSALLGRTSDYVLELKCVSSAGHIFISTQESGYRNSTTEILTHHEKEILARFKKVPRTLSGYNLGKAHATPADLNFLLAGSEGTLAIVSECKLRIKRFPKFKKTILIKYHSFDDALRAKEITLIKPQVIETIDEKLLSMARKDASYQQIKFILDGDNTYPLAVNIIELSSDSDIDLVQQTTLLCNEINNHKNNSNRAMGFYIANTPAEIQLLWSLRKKSVGLISKVEVGKRRPIPFVEDTAVPPENLADYIAEFTKLLDSYSLEYGMYGHIDAGCIHIRPALDMQDSHDVLIMQTISQKVIELLEKYQGVMWGEHGKGYRSQFSKYFFGTKLDFALQQIKTIFDPDNRLNPGKIAIPLKSDDDIVEIHDDLRGKLDATIPDAVQQDYKTVMACNGNGACFDYSNQEIICPSFKVTRDRIHSPKGRAVLMREWLRQLSLQKFFDKPFRKTFWIKKFYNQFSTKEDFSKEVHAAMNGCLNCKACATQCPLSIDVPDFKAKFLEQFYNRYPRPLRDLLLRHVESIAKWQSRFPKFSNFFLEKSFFQQFIRKFFALADLPFAPLQSLASLLDKKYFQLENIKTQDTSNTVLLLQDAFTSFYEPQRVVKIIQAIEKLGFKVYVAPFFSSAKILHVKGYLKSFEKCVQKNSQHLKKLASLGVPLVGIDPSITLTYREEYRKFSAEIPEIKLLQEWLVAKVSKKAKPTQSKNVFLLSHCTEKALCIDAEEQWQTIFAALGHRLIPLTVGCCGMAGVYGHETEHVGLSQKLFALSWEDLLKDGAKLYAATGYSCRSQAKRIHNINLQHPLEIIDALI